MPDSPKFHVGQIVEHRRFSYRGVVYRSDSEFGLSEDWYQQMAITKPPRDKPWYGVLVDNSNQTTYVAERNLIPCEDKSQIEHPHIGFYFDRFDGVEYSVRPMN